MSEQLSVRKTATSGLLGALIGVWILVRLGTHFAREGIQGQTWIQNQSLTTAIFIGLIVVSTCVPAAYVLMIWAHLMLPQDRKTVTEKQLLFLNLAFAMSPSVIGFLFTVLTRNLQMGLVFIALSFLHVLVAVVATHVATKRVEPREEKREPEKEDKVA